MFLLKTVLVASSKIDLSSLLLVNRRGLGAMRFDGGTGAGKLTKSPCGG